LIQKPNRRTFLAIAAGGLAGALALPGASLANEATAPLDYPIEGGHFFRQAAGESARRGLGFRIVDEDRQTFYSEYVRLGGPEALGYPISTRFTLDGYVCQATQRAILQWRPEVERVDLINIMEYLSRLGVDKFLAERRFVPWPVKVDAVGQREDWLSLDAKIRGIYEGARDPLATFGLPLSPPLQMGPAIAMRLQRGVIYRWTTPQTFAGPEQISIANAGDFVKDARGIPAAALEPEAAPAIRSITLPSRGGPRPDQQIAGQATWYGAEFHGLLMFNEEPFNMWDPAIAASNVHPMGTRLRVTRVATGESIVVRVSDRGAFRYPIVVDLSFAAFRKLADPSDGVIRVIVNPLD
jgi:rare lipoprotein A